MVKQQVSGQGAGSTFLGSVCRAFFLFAFVSALMVGYSACRKEEGPPPDPCEQNKNEWVTQLKVKDNAEVEHYYPVYQSGAPIEIEAITYPQDWNKCPKLRQVEIQLVHYKAGVLSTLPSSEVNATDTFLFKKAIKPEIPGDFYVTAVARDEQGEIIAGRQSGLFHVQQLLSAQDPVIVNITSPYDGQKIKKGAVVQLAAGFDLISSGTAGIMKIELLNEGNQVIGTIEEWPNLSDAGGVLGTLDTQKTGQFAIRAITYHRITIGGNIFNFVATNMALSKFTITN